MLQDLGLTEYRVRRYCASLFGPTRHLMLAIGALLPYRLLDRVTGSSLRRGFWFNLKAATAERFVIAAQVPPLTDKTEIGKDRPTGAGNPCSQPGPDDASPPFGNREAA